MSNSLLRGDEIYLRRLQREDLGRTWVWLHDEEVSSRIGVNVPFSPTRQEKWFEAMEEDGSKCVFAICRIEAGDHVGNVSLDMIDMRNRNARLAIFLGCEDARGRGYGSDAVRVVVRYAFFYLNLHRIWCKTDADEPRLAQFYRDLGFELEGRLRAHEFKRGQYVDKLIFGLNAGDAGALEAARRWSQTTQTIREAHVAAGEEVSRTAGEEPKDSEPRVA